MADQNKTEKATPRRRQKAREQGQIARSRDLIAGLGTMTAVMVLAWQLPGFVADWRGTAAPGTGLGRHPSRSIAARLAQRFRPLPRGRPGRGLSWLVATAGRPGAGRPGVRAHRAYAQPEPAESRLAVWDSCFR